MISLYYHFIIFHGTSILKDVNIYNTSFRKVIEKKDINNA